MINLYDFPVLIMTKITNSPGSFRLTLVNHLTRLPGNSLFSVDFPGNVSGLQLARELFVPIRSLLVNDRDLNQ